MIDKILESIIASEVPTDEVGILLSGGVDSLSLAFAAHRLGKKITAYTFHLEGDKSYDALKAEEACNVFGWECNTVVVPTDKLREDFITLAKQYDCRKKTHFECTYPFLYIFPQIEQNYVMTGIAADGYYGLSKKVILNYKEPKELFDSFRTRYFNSPNPAGFIQQEQLATENHKTLVHPYLYNQRVKDFFYQYTWNQLNIPQQKYHVRSAFDTEFSRLTKVKEHINLQLGSNIDHLFETLLDDRMLNNRGRKRIMDLASDYASQGQATLPL